MEVSRGLWGALIKFINAVHGLELVSPFTKLAAAGLLPDRAQPRARVQQECDLRAWKAALDSLNDLGIKPPTGGAWSYTQVQRVIGRAYTSGLLPGNGEPVHR